MIILDTNVISELMKPGPNEVVDRWIDGRIETEIFATAISQAEILFGLELLPRGKRRDALERAARSIFEEDLDHRVLAFDTQAAEHYADIAATRRRAGRPITSLDAQIAAITRAHGATLVTRDVFDFEGCGIDLIDPWST